ncbi:hypothetical protein B296_00041516 [Ensete ventricosum]|uniref:Uncharacterized protein n=1 Tax=Ensete ventricosum TaxID=4639 RepID=A0A426X0L1_ENSVE|nr:hypothetical protein B296_00041516 [Ensete ventricosum]
MNREKLMKMAGAVRTGGKGSMRRFFDTLVMFKLQDLLPAIINQLELDFWQIYSCEPLLTQLLLCLGPDNLENLRKLAEQFQKQAPAASAAARGGVGEEEEEDDDDDVPELVPGETFEEVAEEKQASS